MARSIDKLVSIGGNSLYPLQALDPKIPLVLSPLFELKNGFHAFESALHVFPSGSGEAHLSSQQWNSHELWRAEYEDVADECWFFAEDVFGGQFFVNSDGFGLFDPETGSMEHLCRTLEEWSSRLLQDFDYLTGYSVAHTWQQRHGTLGPGIRLVPKTPFVCGGTFSIDNLSAMDAVKGMRVRANLARQIRDLPDGAQIQFETSE